MDLSARWPLDGHDALRDRLLAAYGDPARGYHDLRHLAEVLAHVDDLRAELRSPGDLHAVRLAAWFHDAVYDRGGDDEERSARLAEQELGGTPHADEVARLVRLTKEHRPADDDRSGQVLCDADLAILAADEERYGAYVAGVRKEYGHVDELAFRRGRHAVLRELLAKPSLFHTATARSRWERPARANLAAELESRGRT